MADYITLMGAEDVRSAASRMASAADEMKQAASVINDSLRRHQDFMDDWLNRLSGTLEDRISDMQKVLG